MKKRIIQIFIFCSILLGTVSIISISFAGDKSGSTFNKSTFDNQSNSNKTFGHDKVLGPGDPPPDPGSDSGNPIDTPADGNIILDSVLLLCSMAFIFAIYRKLYFKSRI